MQGSLVIEKLNDDMLRQQWEAKVTRLARALRDLDKARKTLDTDPTRLAYFEAVIRFAEARDDERLFYWQNFYEQRSGLPKKGMPVPTSAE